MKKLLINTFLGAACLLSCVDASGMESIDDTSALQSGERLIPCDEDEISLKRQQELIKAFQTGNLETVQLLIQQGAKLLNEEGRLVTNSDRNSLLYYAMLGGMPTVEWLWKQTTVDPNESFFRIEAGNKIVAFSPLSMALRIGDREMVKFLIQKGARVLNSRERFWVDSEGNDLLYYALQGNLETLQFLLQQPGVSFSSFYNERKLPLLIAACEVGTAETVGWLIKASGIDVDTVYEIPLPKYRNFYGPSFYVTNALLTAVGHNNVGAIKALLNAGADPNAVVKGLTPLTWAARRNNIKIVKALLDSPSTDVNQVDGIEGAPALLYAAQDRECIEIFKLLLKRNNININNGTPLISAVYGDNVEAVRILLDREEINVNAMSKFDDSALHVAAERGNISIVKLLLEHPKINVNVRNKKGNTPLHLARKEQKNDIVQLLIEKSAQE